MKIKKLSANAVMPKRATNGSAGCDLSACLTEPVTIAMGETAKIGTGIAIALPNSGCAAFIYARSGLGVKNGIVPANCVGVIDSDYRGELIVGLKNFGTEPFTIKHGERIAQMVIAPVYTPMFEESESLDETPRGENGFGSSGR